MTKPLKLRQICFFYIALSPVIKFFSMPSVVAEKCGRDILFSVAANLLIDFALILALILLIGREETDFFTAVKTRVGGWAEKFLLAVFLVYFILKSILPVNEQKDYVELTLYMTAPSPWTFLPVFGFIFYLCLKKLRVIGRISDAVVSVAVVGYLLLFTLSLSGVDAEAFLPVGVSGIGKIKDGAIFSRCWFGDSAFFLFFIGGYKKERAETLKLLLSFGICALITLAFTFVFYGSFSSVAFRQKFALTEIARYSTVINNLERFDFLAVFALLFAYILSVALPFYFATETAERLFGIKRWAAALIAVLPAFILLAFLGEYFAGTETFILQTGNIFFLGAELFSFPFAVIVRLKNRGAKRRKAPSFNGNGGGYEIS